MNATKKKTTSKTAPKKSTKPVSKKYANQEIQKDELAEIKSGKYKLVIVESPSKAKTIKKYLGKGFQVIASNGHIMDLPKSKLGVDVENNFEPDIVQMPGKKAIFDKILKYAENASEIYLGPDPDREGEAIAFHLAQTIGKGKPLHRVLFNAITKSSVIDAINNPCELDINKHNGQKARRVLDRLVGYKISPILWEKVQRGLSAGRVQSVALRLMMEREEEIKAFISEQWFSIDAFVEKNNTPVMAHYYGMELNKKVIIGSQNEVDIINTQTQNQPFIVHDVQKRERKYSATPPFTTAKLQQEAASKLGLSAKKTMMLAQKLYEGVELSSVGLTGLVTYIRTDSVRTEPAALEELREYIKNKYGAKFLSTEVIVHKKRGNAKVQDAHESIRPTSLELSPDKVKSDLDSDEFKLYELIWNKFIASQMSQAIVDLTTVIFACNNHFFKVTGSIEKFAGLRIVFQESLAEKRALKGGEEKDEELILPDFVVGEKLKQAKALDIKEHWTSPPPRYGDASIVKELEEKGIGRPSTYASIISNITDKGYVEKIENRYIPTEVGMVVSKMLIESFPEIMDITFTAKIEELLDKVADEGADWTQIIRDFYGPFEISLAKAKEEMKNLKKTQIPTGVKCLKCDTGEYHIKWGRNGQFFSCSHFPECTSTQDFQKRLDGTYNIIPKTYTEDPCPTCGQRLVVKKGRYGRFVACEEYPNCKTALPFTIGIICPKCNIGKFAEKKSKYGRIFYGCSHYPDCENAMWDTPKLIQCPNCPSPVMGLRETKRIGTHYKCPSCAHVETPEEENISAT